jgi:tetratricopeptide (TPR) repeat protein
MLDVLTDDYYLEETYWLSRPTVVKNAHIWAEDIFETVENDLANWERSYSQIFYANVVLEGVDKITKDSKNERQHNQVKGTAHFLRAWALYNLAQLYAPVYNEATAYQDMGVPIRLKSDVNERVKRNSVEEVYGQILNDLDDAARLVQQEVDFGRPSKAVVYALHARILLVMGDYTGALNMADHSLQEYDVLIDLNTGTLDYRKTLYMALDPNGPFIQVNNQNIQIPDELYHSYVSEDLRLRYFRMNSTGKPYRIASYALGSYNYRGLDTDEQFLVKAECEAYLNQVDNALHTLNWLLKHRYAKETFIGLTATNRTEALEIIREERRKELLFRGVRWMDIKRYNRDGANITLTRKLGNKIYVLPPNSDRWLFPIPANEIKTSGIPQNPR